MPENRHFRFAAAAVMAGGLMMAGACSTIRIKGDESGNYELSAPGLKADFSCTEWLGRSNICFSDIRAGPLNSQVQFWWNPGSAAFSLAKTNLDTNKQDEIFVDTGKKSVKFKSN